MNPIWENEDSNDLFDLLPDEIVLSVFNKLQDAKSLCLSMAVCKRFHSIVPQIYEIFLQVPYKKTLYKEFDQQSQKGFFKNIITKTFIKTLHFITQIMFKSKFKIDVIDESGLQMIYLPNDALKSFDEMRVLHLRLPCDGNQELGSEKRNKISQCKNFLKWKAEFGKELQSCVMFGAKSVSEKCGKEEKSHESRVMGEDDMKLRIVWTISCLIAASARHCLIKETVKTREMIETVIVSDESDQGRVCMNKEQIKELKGCKGKENELECRSNVPALIMKMWYLDKLELSDFGKVMEGVTLVVVRPVGDGCDDGLEEVKRRSEADLVAGAFGEEREGMLVDEAVRKLMVAKKCCTLEINSF